MTWEPPLSFEEKIKDIFIPPQLYIAGRVRKELRKGEKEIHLLPFLVDRERAAIDVGANKGVWTYVLAGLCRHVHAFEPNPKLFRILKRGIGDNVTAHRIALSNESGTAELRIPKKERGYSNQGGSLSTIKVTGEYGSVRVEAARLDDLDLTNVGFIKIDVEGHELAVLEGARELIRRDRPTMIIEMEEAHTKRPIEELLSAVQAYGYRCLALRRGTLTDIAEVDFDAHHRHARSGDYIFNFVFLPHPTPASGS